jgi:[acyl-carrier-protein] S-malonyltransferase
MTQAAGIAHVFPGQGSQVVGMGRDLCEAFPAAKQVFEQADKVLGFPLSKMCFEGPDDQLQLTINAQPALVTMSYACLQSIASLPGAVFPKPSFVAGHSLGEYTALLEAGVIDFPATVTLARERGRLMYETGVAVPGAMAAILGLDENVLVEVCRETDTTIANYNCPGQLVISGKKENIVKAIELAKAKGAARAMPLAVSGAFHSPLMQPAREGLAKAIAGIAFKDPSVPVIGNVTAKPIVSGKELKQELIDQLTSGVQWQRCVEFMVAQGVSTFIEIGSGKVLSGMIKRINKAVAISNIGDVESIRKLAAS